MIDVDIATLKLRDCLARWSSSESVIPPMTICDVDPAEIERYVEYAVFKKYDAAGRIEPGRWDLAAAPLESSPKYRLIREYHRGVVDSADLTEELLIDRGYPDREARFYAAYGYGTYLDELFASIRANGIDSDRSLSEAGASRRDRYDQIAVNVGRDGAVIFNSCGFHRLATSRLLGLATVPVRINAIHERWWDGDRSLQRQLVEHPSLIDARRMAIPWSDMFAHRLDS